jgi:Spy/CpxP family protein refolding chaperone
MNYFNKKKVVIMIIAILLIVNVATISTIIFRTYHHPPGHPPIEKTHKKSFKRFWKDLNLNKEQRKTFGEFRKQYWKDAKIIFNELHNNRVQIMDEFSSLETDSIRLYELAKESGDLHEKLKVITLNHLLDMKKVCTPKQFKYLRELFKKAIMEENFVGRKEITKRIKGIP